MDDFTTAEELIGEINKGLQEARLDIMSLELLVKKLQSSETLDWDWVSVKSASEKFNISTGLIYKLINQQKINTKKYGSKILVSCKEIMEYGE